MRLSPGKLLPLRKIENYRILFHDVNFWSSFVHEVCHRHQLYPMDPVICRVPGTYPTFIVAEHWVVKFFGELFDGGTCFRVEKACAQLLAEYPVLPCPVLLASGYLFDSPQHWSWPYLVFEYLPGVSIGEVYQQVNQKDWLEIARQMGEWVNRLHALPIPVDGPFSLSWDEYRSFLAKQKALCTSNHRRWNSLPVGWVEQIDEFLLPVDELLDEKQTHMIHADLTADHLLVQEKFGSWEILGIIDFGDAMVGSLEYELVALQLDLFRGNRLLLKSFLDAYGLDLKARRDLPRRVMSAALLHQFDVFVRWQERLPLLKVASTLADFANLAWGDDL
jgi:hygromycin-B 7''-O-kinase